MNAAWLNEAMEVLLGMLDRIATALEKLADK